MADNPFRQPLRRKNALYKTYVRNALANGKDAGSNTNFAIGKDYLWIAFDFSVPLAWIREVAPLGPGFVVTWDNPIERREESAAFCILRTGWGYNTKKRDDLVRRVREAVSQTTFRPTPETVAVAATASSCQVCPSRDPRVFDFQWFTSFLVYSINKPDRRVLCLEHGASRFRMVTAYNLVAGNLGVGALVSPVISIRNIRHTRGSGAISRPEAVVWTTLALWPYLILGWLIAGSLWAVIRS